MTKRAPVVGLTGMLADLAVAPFSEILRRLSAERCSGDLQVRSGKFVKTVFFDAGRVVFAASNLKKDRLGESLVELGDITGAQFEQASALMKGDRKRRFGEALVQAGVMEKNEVGRLVARQVKRIVASLFPLVEGVVSLEERPCAIPLEYMVSLSIHRLLYVGIKTMISPELVLAGLGDLDRWVKLADVPPFPFGAKKCSAEELEIMELAKRRVTLRRLAWAPGGLAFPRLRAAYALSASGVLDDAEHPSSPRPIVQVETSTFLLSALQRRPDPAARDIIRKEVDGELARSANLDREKWLRLSSGAPRDELVRALEEKMERYHALLEAVGDDEALKTDIELILGRASSMLRLTRQAAPPSEVLPREAGPPAPAAAAPPVPAPAREKPPKDQPAVAPPPEPEPASAPPAPEQPAQRAHQPGELAASAQVEHLLMEASVRMTVGDYANAVKVYQRLIDLAPKTAGFRVRLAIAMTFYPRTQKDAERQFFEAVRLDPDNADIHFQFGLYYKAMKVRSRAIAELKTAVQLSPRHKQARAELEALSPKDSALTSLKKLFK
jgi:hypothetical protein